MKDLIAKLDLSAYISSFESFLARQKPLFVNGDLALNFARLGELSSAKLTAPKPVIALNDAIERLGLMAVLHISEIYEFSKIISYFIYLKNQQIGTKTDEYLAKIEIPDKIAEICSYFSENGELKDSVDERLISINEAMRRLKSQIDESLRSLMRSKSLANYLVDFNVHFISGCECLLLRGGFNASIKGAVMGRTQAGYFYVFPSSIEALKNEQSALLDRKEEIIYEHAKRISALFSQNVKFLRFIDGAFDYIDALLARVFFARSRDYSFVMPSNDGAIKLCEFAHPALKNPKRISIDFTRSVLLVTGVNAGGKSMLLKSVLSAAFCAKYLLPLSINASKSKISSFKEIDAIIEDPQNVKDDISTFAGRMQSWSKLFSKKNLLLGVDEIELGTDAAEAAALYSVLIEELIKNGIKMIITTHHKQLALNLSKNENVELLAALYDEKNSRPKYEFLAGIIGKSYAFETALRYSVPPSIVEAARKLGGGESFNEAITKAINLELELKTKIKATDEKSAKLEGLIENLKEQKIAANDELKALRAKLEREFFYAISEAKKAINLKDTKEKHRSINKANELAKAIEKPQIAPPPVLKIGDSVKYGNIKAKVLSLSKNDANIEANGIKMRVPLTSLTKGGVIVQSPATAQVKVEAARSASVMIDLHGLRSEEAVERLDKFISDALLAGLDEVLIKHGIGTGKLAYAVKEFLKAHPSIKGFRDGAPNEGGFGSKIVKL
ncbi:endonuclease MutS2 [Campylobacter sp.]|uniref:endonuclease MutS2 n=1 Tax=Campylobacter sp. TaxID=205 RepID=UPI002A62A535|nr:endonuclease MutS2 [Campylobacter sp.]MDD7704451.1 endonuclease MutS2 [Campylobacteraceae bacterium]MDY2636032.1 endonuclease MutS2 [Campylobacter sp.]